MPSRLLVSDPLCRPWRAHLRASPVLRGQRILVARFALAWATGVAPSPCLAGLLHDVERACLEAGPALRRVYATAPADPGLRRLGYVTLPGEPAVDLDGRSYRAVVCDLGPDSVAGWVSDLAARDLNVRDAVLDPDGRELVLDGRRVTLAALECDVLGYMRDRAGAVVSREELLREVWGYDWTGGSNVVEVAISALRRKLGDRASAVETVRGRGYRLRGL